MNKDIVSYGKIEGNRLVLAQEELLKNAIANFKDGPVELVIKRWRPNRSDSQNAWYHSCIVPAITDAINELQGEEAFSRTEIHEYLKAKFNTKDIFGEGDKEIRIAQSTSNLTTVQFADFCEKCRLWATEMLGITIVDPDKDFVPKSRKRRNQDDVFVQDAYTN